MLIYGILKHMLFENRIILKKHTLLFKCIYKQTIQLIQY